MRVQTIIGYRRNGCPIYLIQGGAPEEGEQAPPEPGKQFTPPASQDELDRLIGERVARERAKYADHDELKKKAQQWDDQEAKNRTDLENAQAQAAAEKERADKADLRADKAEVAAEKGVPVSLLAGSTREELESSADALLAFRGEPKAPKVTVVTPGDSAPVEKSVANGAAKFHERRKPQPKE